MLTEGSSTLRGFSDKYTLRSHFRQFILTEQADGQDDKTVNGNRAEDDPDVVIVEHLHHNIHVHNPYKGK